MFIAYQKSLELVTLVETAVMPALRSKDAELASQLHRAVRSVPLNVAEGSVQRGKRRAVATAKSTPVSTSQSRSASCSAKPSIRSTH